MPDEKIVNPLGEPAEEPLSAKRPDAAQILRVFTDAYDAMKPRNVRVETTRDIRRGTLMVGVNKLWTMKFREAAPFVQSFLPERRTLERSVKASVGAVVPQISRAATGDTQGDDENAEWAEFYLNELRKRRFPARQCFGKGTEDGEYAFIVVPDAATMDGQPLYADTVTAARYKALKPAERKQYTPYGVVRNGVEPRRYVKLAGAWSDGTPKEGRNPEYDRDSSGRRRDDKYYTKPKDGADRPTFKRDEDKSGQAFDEAQRRYRAAHLPVTSLVMPALDVAPLLVRSKDGEHWALKAMVTRQLLGVEEAISAGYRWAGMGDRLLLPMGYEQDRMCGQRGMFYLYQLYTEEYDDDGRCHPLILSTVLGINGQTKQTDASNSNVDVLDLYDEWGIDVPLWDYCGGMSLSDDDPAFAYEPWMFPFINRILKIEGVETLSDMAMWENGNTGYVQDINPAFESDVLLDSSGGLRLTKVPDPGEVVGATGPVHPFAEQRVNPDFRYREESLRNSLREQTIAEQQGGDGESGHQLVVQHTLSVVAKDDIRAGVLRACKLFARGAARILDALSERGINWPIETSDDRPIGSKTVSKGSLIEWSRDWLGGSYEFEVEYPSEANPVEVSLAMEAWQKRAGSWEDLQKARGKSDAQSERLKVAEDEFWESDYGRALRQLAVAEYRRDQKAQKLAKLQVDKALAAIGLPGMEDGVPMGLLGGEGQPQPQMQGGPSAAAGTSSQQLVGSIVGSNSGAGPAANDARAIGQIPGAQGVGGVNGAVPGAA